MFVALLLCCKNRANVQIWLVLVNVLIEASGVHRADCSGLAGRPIECACIVARSLLCVVWAKVRWILLSISRVCFPRALVVNWIRKPCVVNVLTRNCTIIIACVIVICLKAEARVYAVLIQISVVTTRIIWTIFCDCDIIILIFNRLWTSEAAVVRNISVTVIRRWINVIIIWITRTIWQTILIVNWWCVWSRAVVAAIILTLGLVRKICTYIHHITTLICIYTLTCVRAVHRNVVFACATITWLICKTINAL